MVGRTDSRDGLAVLGRLEVRLLGSIEVFGADGPLTVAGHKLKAIVAMLALAAYHAVSDDISRAIAFE